MITFCSGLCAVYCVLGVLSVWVSTVGSEETDPVKDPNNCSHDVLAACSSYSMPSTFNFAASKSELDEQCPYISKSIRCIDDYTRRCFEPSQRSHFNKIYSGSAMVMQEICHDGPYQEEFLRHAPCMSNELKKDYEDCSSDYQRKLVEMNNDPKGQDTRVLCCSLQEFLTCSKNLVRKTCGDDTARFAAGFLDKMANSLLQTHCEENPSSPYQCNSYSAAPLHLSGLAMFLPLYITLL